MVVLVLFNLSVLYMTEHNTNYAVAISALIIHYHYHSQRSFLATIFGFFVYYRTFHFCMYFCLHYDTVIAQKIFCIFQSVIFYLDCQVKWNYTT